MMIIMSRSNNSKTADHHRRLAAALLSSSIIGSLLLLLVVGNFSINVVASGVYPDPEKCERPAASGAEVKCGRDLFMSQAIVIDCFDATSIVPDGLKANPVFCKDPLTAASTSCANEITLSDTIAIVTREGKIMTITTKPGRIVAQNDVIVLHGLCSKEDEHLLFTIKLHPHTPVLPPRKDSCLYSAFEDGQKECFAWGWDTQSLTVGCDAPLSMVIPEEAFFAEDDKVCRAPRANDEAQDCNPKEAWTAVLPGVTTEPDPDAGTIVVQATEPLTASISNAWLYCKASELSDIGASIKVSFFKGVAPKFPATTLSTFVCNPGDGTTPESPCKAKLNGGQTVMINCSILNIRVPVAGSYCDAMPLPAGRRCPEGAPAKPWTDVGGILAAMPADQFFYVTYDDVVFKKTFEDKATFGKCSAAAGQTPFYYSIVFNSTSTSSSSPDPSSSSIKPSSEDTTTKKADDSGGVGLVVYSTSLSLFIAAVAAVVWM